MNSNLRINDYIKHMEKFKWSGKRESHDSLIASNYAVL